MKRTPVNIPRASKEVILEAKNLSNPAGRFLVSNYYAQQKARERQDMQLRHLGDSVESELVQTLEWMASAAAGQENQVKRALKAFAEGSLVGRWCVSHYGVGPVIAAGLLAHIDIEKAPTVGHIWSFAGLNPQQEWNKGEKRPYNAELKQLTYHLGECFKRTSGEEKSFYGQFYKERKALIVKRNEAGHFAERAKTFKTNSADVKKILAKGKLPDLNLDRQACNITVKIFLSHLHAVMYWDHYKEIPPKPFAMAILGHAHEVKIPHLDMFPGLEEAYYPTKGGRKKPPAKAEPKTIAKKKTVTAKTPVKKTRKRILEAAE